MLASFLLTATPGGGGEFDIFANILETRGVVLAVLIVLVIMSLACWFIIALKWIRFARIRSTSKRFVSEYWEASTPKEVYELAERSACPEGRVFVAGMKEIDNGFENVERAVRRSERSALTELESLIGFLGTTGSTAPFIGLFGTVWGIMVAFAGLGQMEEGANLLTIVTPHIAEALVATAVGLLAAIPAVMAYNYFVRRTRIMISDLGDFSADYLNTIRRTYFKGS